jgi:hypothetical protein
MQFGIGLFEPLQHRLRGALRFGRAVHIHIGSGQGGGPDFFAGDKGFKGRATADLEVITDTRELREIG